MHIKAHRHNKQKQTYKHKSLSHSCLISLNKCQVNVRVSYSISKHYDTPIPNLNTPPTLPISKLVLKAPCSTCYPAKVTNES